MVNNFVGIGRLTSDVELRKTGNNKSVVSFTLAINQKFNKDKTDFIRCVAWEQTADFMANYLSKGSLVSVEGRIESGMYEKDGVKVYTQDVVAQSVQALESKAQREGTAKPVYEKKEEKILDIDSSSLPF